MSKLVEVPGVGVVEFPDDMADDAIGAALAKSSGPPMLPSHGAAAAPSVGRTQSGVLGAMQGGSFGFGDEIAGAVSAVLPEALRMEEDRKAVAPGLSDLVKGSAGDTLADRYHRARDYYRQKNAAAQEANPGTYLTGQIGGSVATGKGLPVKGVTGALSAAGQGLAQGAGYSNADSATGLAGDTALGGGLGLLGNAAGRLLGAATSKVARTARGIADAARARAGVQAAEEAAGVVQSAAGKLGGEMQKGSRQVENLMRLRESMTPQQAAIYDELVKRGIVPELQQSVAQSTLETLPEQAATIAARKAELAAAQQAAPAAAASRATDLLSTDEAKRQLAARAWRYGPPAIGSLVGSAIGGPMGTAVGFLAGAGSRPMVQSMRRMAKTPAVQRALGEAIEGAASRAGEVGALVPSAAASQVAALAAALRKKNGDETP